MRRAMNAIRRLVRALRLGNRQAEGRAGISAAQLFVLQCVGRSGPLSLKAVAARTATDQSSVSVVVDRLARRGLVSRRRAAQDARRLEIALTPRGTAVLARAPGRAAPHALLRGLRELPPGELRRLARLLDRVVVSMGFGERAPRMLFEDEDRTAR